MARPSKGAGWGWGVSGGWLVFLMLVVFPLMGAPCLWVVLNALINSDLRPTPPATLEGK